MDLELTPEWLAQTPPQFQALPPEQQKALVQRLQSAIEPAGDTMPVDKSTGVPAKVRAAVGAAETPEDKLSTIRKSYPAAEPYGEGNFVVPDYDRRRWVMANPPGLDAGDVAGAGPEIAQILGSTAGASAGAFAGPLTSMAGAGLGGSLAREGEEELAKRLFGTVDTRSAGNRLYNAGVNAAFDAAGQGIGLGGPAVVRRFLGPRDPAAAANTLRNMEDIGAPPSAGSVTQNPNALRIERAAGAFPGGARVIGAMERGQSDAMNQELQNIIQGGSSQPPTTPYEAGAALKRGRDVADQNYDQTREQLYQSGYAKVGDSTPVFPDSVAGLDAELARQEALGNGMFDKSAQRRELQRIIGDPNFPPRAQRFDAFRAKRTEVGEDWKNPPEGRSGGNQQKFNRDFYGAMTEDANRTADIYGGRQEMDAANQYMSDYLKGPAPHLEQIDKATPEGAYAYVTQGGKTDVGRLRELAKVMPRDAWDTFRSTYLRQMGKPRPGATGALENNPEFSASTFLTNWADKNFSPEAKAILFNNKQYAGMREALDRLVDVATANKAAATTRNFSNTANSATGAAVLGGATAQVLGGDIKGGAKTVIAGTLAPYLTAKLMTSPRFVHWLVGAQSAAGRSPTALGPWIGRLGVIASEHPELAQDIGPLMSAMLHPVDSIRGQRDRQAP